MEDWKGEDASGEREVIWIRRVKIQLEREQVPMDWRKAGGKLAVLVKAGFRWVDNKYKHRPWLNPRSKSLQPLANDAVEIVLGRPWGMCIFLRKGRLWFRYIRLIA